MASQLIVRFVTRSSDLWIMHEVRTYIQPTLEHQIALFCTNFGKPRFIKPDYMLDMVWVILDDIDVGTLENLLKLPGGVWKKVDPHGLQLLLTL